LLPKFKKSNRWIDGVSRKVESLVHFWRDYDYDHVIFLDIDAYIIAELGGLFAQDFDVALTRFNRPKSHVSSGLFFLKRNDRTSSFIDRWNQVQTRFKRMNKHRKGRGGSVLDQKSLTIVSRKMHRMGELSVLPIDYDEYSFKVKDLSRWKKLKGLDDKRRRVRIREYESNRKRVIGSKDIKVLHFYGNSYRNPELVSKVFREAGVKPC